MTPSLTDIPHDSPRSCAVPLFGNGAVRRRDFAHAIAVSGGRVVAGEPMLGAADKLAAQSVVAGVVLDLREDRGAWLDAGGEKGSRQLAQLSEEVERIARPLAALAMDNYLAPARRIIAPVG